MTNIIQRITSTFFPYHGEPERSDPDLWLLIAQVGIKEIELDLRSGKNGHAAKEFADLAFVAIDGLSKMGYDVESVMDERLAEIKLKDMSDRNKTYYREKLSRLEVDLEKLNAQKSP